MKNTFNLILLFGLIFTQTVYASVSLFNRSNCETKFLEDKAFILSTGFESNEIPAVLFQRAWIEVELDFFSECNEKNYSRRKFEYPWIIYKLKNAKYSIDERYIKNLSTQLNDYHVCADKLAEATILVNHTHEVLSTSNFDRVDEDFTESLSLGKSLETCKNKLPNLERPYELQFAKILEKLGRSSRILRDTRRVLERVDKKESYVTTECREVIHEVNSYLEMLTNEYMKNSQKETLQKIQDYNLKYLKDKMVAYQNECGNRTFTRIAENLKNKMTQIEYVLNGNHYSSKQLVAYGDKDIKKRETILLYTKNGAFPITITALLDGKSKYTWAYIDDSGKSVKFTTHYRYAFTSLSEEHFKNKIIQKVDEGYRAEEGETASLQVASAQRN